MNRLENVLATIDAANAQDPTLEDGAPAALLYGRRMSARLADFQPDAGEALQIAVRGQHVERWTIPRAAYPLDRPGYLAWRNALKDMHAHRIAGFMTAAGYDPTSIARAGQIVRKEGLKTDAETQTLEDVACLVFLEFYAAPFLARHDIQKSTAIVAKTWRKMSEAGHAAALALPLPPEVTAIVARALGNARLG